jgi:16S rRNA (guanine527-N7)-methyltransferase
LQEKALDHGMHLSYEHLRLFEVYLNELLEWNSRMNLTGLKEQGKMMSELFLDSLIPVPYLPTKGRMLDVGSGAGFPAIVIKVLLPNLKLQLVEANAKKASFIKQVVRLLKLKDTEVINGRIEEVGVKLRLDGFDIISARALANLNQIIKWCSPLLSRNGMLVYFSGNKVDESLRDAEYLLSEQHLSLVHLIPYFLPGVGGGRNIVALKKHED